MAHYSKNFIVDDGIKKIGLRGIYLIVENILNKPDDDNFELIKKNIIRDILNSEESTPVDEIKNDVIFDGFRKLPSNVGAPNRKNLSAGENLFRLLCRNSDIPRINLLVDIYNIISVKYKLALGAHDLSKIEGDIQLRFTDGNENYIPLGEMVSKTVPPGEYSYIDDSNDIICYLDVRQVDKTKVTLGTTDVFLIIQGNEATPIEYLRNAEQDLVSLINQFCGGKAFLLTEIF